jgi:outer membrane protein assembly factor BamB
MSRRLGDTTELARYAARLKQRLLDDRAAFEAVAEKGRAGALRAALDLADIAALRAPRLAKQPATLESPLGAEVVKTLEAISTRYRALLALLPAALVTRRSADLIGELLTLFDSYETLIVRQLALVHRQEVPDYFAGLDADAPFPSYRYSASNRGRVPRFALARQGAARSWNTKIGGLIWPSPIIGKDGTLYTGHAGGEFVALNPDGSVRWRMRDDRMMYIDSTGALGKDGYLYMASTDRDPRGHQNQGRIWKIDPASGEVIWAFWGRHFEDPESNPNAHLSSFFEGNLTLAEESGRLFVYAGSDDNFLYKIDSDGELVWEYDTDSYPSGVIWTKPLLSADGASVFVGDLAGQVHGVDAATGRRRWARRLGGSVVSSPAMGNFGELFLGSFDGKVYALAPEDGTVFWSYQTLGLIYSSPAVAENGDVVIGSSDGGLYRVNRFGRRVWTYYTDAPIKSSPVIDPDGCAYVGNQGGKLYCIAADGRRVWSLHTNRDIADNDVNCSPTMGPDGTVFFGTTTGEVFAVPADYYYVNRQDDRIDLAPGHDGRKPAIPAGGAMLVFMNRNGTPLFEPPRDLAISENLNMAFFAVDDDLDIIPAELEASRVRVDITPELPVSVRVESMGRFVYVAPEGFMEYATEYSVRAAGSYTALGERREFDSVVNLRTIGRGEEAALPLAIGPERVTGVALDGFKICQPKELDALGQAMMDSLKFGVAPVYIDEERHFIVLAACALTDAGGTLEYAPASVNKLLLKGRYRDGYFKVQGSMRLIAQGANIPIDKAVFGGRFTDGPGIEDGTAFIAASVDGVPDFADIIRVMRLADSRGDVVGFCTYEGVPFESYALARPQGVAVEVTGSAGRLEARFEAPGYRAEDHWLQVILIDRETGDTLDGHRVDVTSAPDGSLEKLVSAFPAEYAGGSMTAIVTLDLFPVAKIDL